MVLLFILMSMFIVVDVIVDVDEFLEAGELWAQEQLIADEATKLGVSTQELSTLLDRQATAEEVAQTLRLPTDQAERVLEATSLSFTESVFGVGVIMLDWYVPMLLLIYTFIAGLLVVGGMGFTLAQMLRNRELTALLASGISMHRIAMPMMVVGIGLCLLTLPIQEFLLPPVAQKLIRSKGSMSQGTIEQFPVYLTPDDRGALLTASSFDRATSRMTDVVILERDETGRAVRRISAQLAQWQEDGAAETAGDQRSDNESTAPETTPISNLSDTETRLRTSGGGGWFFPVGGFAVDLDARLEPVPVMFYETDLSPEILVIRQASSYPRFLSLRELQGLQTNPAVDGRMRTEVTTVIWSRFSQLVVNALVLVLGLRFFLLRSPNSNLLMQSLKASGVCLGAWGLSLLLPEVLANGAVPPAAASWMPVVILLPVAVYLQSGVET